MDVLSDVLRVVRMNGGGFLTAEFSEPWSIFSPPADELARLMATRAESVALFHILVEGRAWIGLDGWKPLLLKPGSVILFPHSPSHRMSSAPDLAPEPIVPLLRFSADRQLPEIRHGGTGDITRFVCGYLRCEERFNPLIGALPAMLLVTPEPDDAGAADPALAQVVTDSDDWLHKTLWHIVDEAVGNRPGCAAMLSRLTELFYVEVLRRYMQQTSAEDRGWLAAVNDAQVGRALRLLHAEPKRKWTVEELGRAIGLSRSALAERFSELVGESPIQYLTRWRMQLAKGLLSQTDLSPAEIAHELGYSSEVSFSRAFKRHTDSPPVAWREASSARPGSKSL